MQFPKVLVLGATGQIGQILHAYWKSDRIIWQSRSATRGPNWVQIDPTRGAEDIAASVPQLDAILCLAGATPAAVNRKKAYYSDNWRLAEVALQTAALTKSRAYLVSSAAVYGRQTGVLTETLDVHPASDYGHAKHDMEVRAAQLSAELGVFATTLRIGNVAGADAILGGWRPGFELHQFSDGTTPSRSYIGPRSLASILAALVGRGNAPDLINIALPKPVEMGWLLDAAHLDWAPVPAPETAIRSVELDTRCLQSLVDLPDPANPEELLVAEWQDFLKRGTT